MSCAGFVVDLHRCTGCSACVLACRIENGRTSEAAWRRVLPLNLRRTAGGPTYFLSVACHHCDNPACLNGCPAGAYEKRPDGVVIHREERCLGCRYCEMACPFGTPQFDATRGVVSKCHLCSHRLDEGLAPACVRACPTEALQFAANTEVAAAGARTGVPGFADPADCRPNLRFTPPRGSRRGERFAAFDEVMKRER